MKKIKLSTNEYSLEIEYDENKIDLEDILKECLKTVRNFKEDSMLDYLNEKEFNICGAW
jgi:hypothetical protein